MRVGSAVQAQVQWFACAWRGWRACLGAYMRTTHHVRHCCAQNADHLAHGSPLSAFFAEVVCSLAATPPPVGAWPTPNGGNGVIRGTTRRRHAASQFLMLQNPHQQPASCTTSPTRPGRRADWRERTRPTQPLHWHFRKKFRPAGHQTPFLGCFERAGRTFSRSRPPSDHAGRTFSRTRRDNVATLKPTTPLLTPEQQPLKPPSPLHPKTPNSHPQ